MGLLQGVAVRLNRTLRPSLSVFLKERMNVIQFYRLTSVCEGRARSTTQTFFRSTIVFRRLIYAVCVFCLAQAAVAQDLDINLNGNAVQFQYGSPIAGHARINSSELNASALFTTNDSYIFGAGVKLQGQAGSGSPGLQVGMGAKLFGGSVKSKGMMALALDGAVRYSPPPVPRVGIGAELYYAPGILSFIEANSFLQAVLRLEYEVLPDSYVYVGVRTIRVDVNGRASKTVDSGGLVGLQLHF